MVSGNFFPVLLLLLLLLQEGVSASKLQELITAKGQMYSFNEANTALAEDVTNGQIPEDFIKAVLLQDFSYPGYPIKICYENFANLLALLKSIKQETWTAPSDTVAEAMGIAVLRFFAFPHPQFSGSDESKEYPPTAEFIIWLFEVATNLEILYEKAAVAVEKYQPATVFELHWMKHFSGQRVFEFEGERYMRTLSQSQLKSYLPYLKLLVDVQANAPWDATRKLYGINYFLHGLSRAKMANYIEMIVEALAENSTNLDSFVTTLVYVNNSPGSREVLRIFNLPKTVNRVLKYDALKYFYFHLDKLRSYGVSDADRKDAAQVQSVLKQLLPQLANSLGLMVMAHPNALFYRRMLRLLLETKTFSVAELGLEENDGIAARWPMFFAKKAASSGSKQQLFAKKFSARFLEILSK